MSEDWDKDLEGPWPKEGDRLFVESHWGTDAHLVRSPAERFYRMPIGYKRAGDILVDNAAAEPADRQNIVYAALFCYRQAIELFLKRLIEEFGQKTLPSLNTHDLSDLCTGFVRLTEDLGGAEAFGFEATAALVKEMNDADKKSDGFRFATDSKGAPFTFGDRGIDLRRLREVMGALENFFECAYMAYEIQING
jgi:hypothetical protein